MNIFVTLLFSLVIYRVEGVGKQNGNQANKQIVRGEMETEVLASVDEEEAEAELAEKKQKEAEEGGNSKSMKELIEIFSELATEEKNTT